MCCTIQNKNFELISDTNNILPPLADMIGALKNEANVAASELTDIAKIATTSSNPNVILGDMQSAVLNIIYAFKSAVSQLHVFVLHLKKLTTLNEGRYGPGINLRNFLNKFFFFYFCDQILNNTFICRHSNRFTDKC